MQDVASFPRSPGHPGPLAPPQVKISMSTKFRSTPARCLSTTVVNSDGWQCQEINLYWPIYGLHSHVECQIVLALRSKRADGKPHQARAANFLSAESPLVLSKC
jgi:hypothetical protein